MNDAPMSTPNPNRPWYCPDRLTDDWVTIAKSGGDLRMLKALKILRSIIVNVGIVSITLIALIETSADPTWVAGVGLVTLGAYNGVEVADYAALVQAFAEAKNEQNRDD